MKLKLWTLIGLSALLLSCGNAPSGGSEAGSGGPAAGSQSGSEAGSGVAGVITAYPQGSIKKGDKAYCAVCAVKDGTTEMEEVSETIDYQGKTYGFCDESEKAEFISDPGKYAARP